MTNKLLRHKGFGKPVPGSRDEYECTCCLRVRHLEEALDMERVRLLREWATDTARLREAVKRLSKKLQEARVSKVRKAA